MSISLFSVLPFQWIVVAAAVAAAAAVLLPELHMKASPLVYTRFEIFSPSCVILLNEPHLSQTNLYPKEKEKKEKKETKKKRRERKEEREKKREESGDREREVIDEWTSTRE